MSTETTFFLTETKKKFNETTFYFDREQNNFNRNPQNEDEVEGAKPPDEVECTENLGERSEPDFCKN